VKIALERNLIVNHEKQIVSDSMYNHNDYYLKFYILHSIVLTIQKVCRFNLLQVPRVRYGKTLHRQKRLLSFQNEHFFVFNDKPINSVPQKNNILV